MSLRNIFVTRRDFKVGGRIQLDRHHGRIVDATAVDVLTEGDRIELQLDVDKDRTA